MDWSRFAVHAMVFRMNAPRHAANGDLLGCFEDRKGSWGLGKGVGALGELLRRGGAVRTMEWIRSPLGPCPRLLYLAAIVGPPALWHSLALCCVLCAHSPNSPE